MTIDKLIEKFGSISLGIIFFLIILIYVKPEYEEYKALVDSCLSVSTNIFGFLLALLGIILQGNSSTIEAMRRRHILYKKFINLNRKVVIIAFIIIFYSICLKFNDNYYYEKGFEFINSIFVSIFFGCCSVLFAETMYFIIIFYLLLKNTNGESR